MCGNLLRGSTSWRRPATQTSRTFASSPKSGPSQTTRFASRPARTSPAIASMPSILAGFTVSAASSSSCVVPESIARRAAFANVPTSRSRTVLAAAGTPARSSSARFAGANAQCASSRSGTASAARGDCRSGARGKSNGTTTGRPVAFTAATSRYSRPLPMNAASSRNSSAMREARSRLRSSEASNHARCAPRTVGASAASALASCGGSLPAGFARHVSVHRACHAASASVCRTSAIEPISAPG